MLRPFFSFFGGKWRAAPYYPDPTHKVIIEPFAGSAGYSIRHASHQIILIERDPIIASIWDYLIHVSEKEIRSLPLSISHVDRLKVSQEAKYLVGFWLNAATTHPCLQPSSLMRWRLANDNISGVFWGESVRERIASQLQYIRHWKIFHSSYTKLPDDLTATWFIDPPYQRTGYRYRFSDIRYSELAKWIKTRSGQIIACEQKGADWLPFKNHLVTKTMSTPGRDGYSNEVYYYRNRD